jgi:hypothetical protein
MSARFSHVFFMRAAQDANADIHIGEMMRAIASDKSIVSAVVTNKTDRGMTLDVKAAAWRHEGDLDVLSPSRDIRVGPGAFFLAPRSTQIVRFGVTTHEGILERAYHVTFSNRDGGELAAFPIFVAPVGAKASLCAYVVRNEHGARVILANVGRAHAQIREVESAADANAGTPFYLLAGGRVELPLLAAADDVRIVSTDVDGAARTHGVRGGERCACGVVHQRSRAVFSRQQTINGVQ